MDQDWDKKKILLVGETVLDIIQVVPKYPKEDDDAKSNHGRWQRGGNASNSSTVLALMGENVELLSNFSTAEMFKFVIHDLTVRGIDHKNCVYYDNCEPPLSSIWLSEETGSRTIVHSNPNLPHMTFEGFDKCDLREYKWIHFEGRTPEVFRKMMEKVRTFSDRIKISVELEKPRGNDMLLVDFADYVFLGKAYARDILKVDNKKEAVYRLKELVKRANFTIICPWETKGAAILDAENNFMECPSFPPEKALDSLGAGDTFAGSTLYALNQHLPVDKAVEFGSRIAGAKVGFYGYDPIKDIYKNFLPK